MKKQWIIPPVVAVLCTVVLGATLRRVELTSFNAGEMSPLMNARSDFAKTKAGAKTLQNMIVRAQGPVQRRPGTKYIAAVKDANDPTRLFSFEYATNDAYVIEAGDQYARFLRNGGQILDDSNDPYEITTPWDANDIFEVQYAQDAQYMRLVHEDYPPYKLTRTDHAAWTCTQINFEHGPFSDENENTALTIDPSGTGSYSGTDYYITGEDGQKIFYGVVWLAQTFTAADTYTASGVQLKLYKRGNPGTVTVSLKETAAGKPTGDDLTSGTLDGDSLTTNVGGQWYQVNFSATQALTSGTVYAIVVRATTAQMRASAVYWRMDGSSPSYSGGSYIHSSNSGTDWTAYTAGDFMFGIVNNAVVASTIDLAASGPIFDEDHVGALWRLTHSVDSVATTGTFTATGYIDHGGEAVAEQFGTQFNVALNQDFQVITSGYWIGLLTIQKSYDDGTTWQAVGTPFQASTGLENMNYFGTEETQDAVYRLKLENYLGKMFHRDEAYLTFKYTCTAIGYDRQGIVRISAYTDPCNVTADVLYTLGDDDATSVWAEGAWSDYRGWPRTITHHEGRCVYGGSTSYPQTIWASIIADKDEDYDNFAVAGGLTEDDAWTYILPGMNPIQWLMSTEYLMVGTAAGVGRLGTPDKPINPTWPPMYRTQPSVGCAYIQPVAAVDALLYVERGGQKIRELAYTYTSDRYVAADMTILAEHITGNGITQIAFQNRPDPILWATREDGVLLSFTYQRKHDVLAWSTHSTGTTDDVNSIAVIAGTNEDVAYWMVRRDVNSASVGYIECAQPFDWGTDQNDCYFVDSGVDDVDNLSHLEGRTVALWADGRPIKTDTFTVASGSIDPDDANLTEFTVGLPFTSIFETMPLVTVDEEGVPTAAARVRIADVQVDCLKSLGFHIGPDAARLSDIRFSTNNFATTMDVYTGLKPEYGPMNFPYGWRRDPVLYITESDPVPLTIRGLIVHQEVAWD